jgi:hypothetical protein
MNVLQGFGDAAMKEAGLPTEYERQNQDIINKQRQAQTDSEAAEASLKKAQAQGLLDTIPVTMENGMTYHLPKALATKILEQQTKNQGGVAVQGLKNEGALDTQGAKNEGSLDTQALKNQGALAAAKARADALKEVTSARIKGMLDAAGIRAGATIESAHIRAQNPFLMQGMKSYDVALDADQRLSQMQEQAANPNPAGDKALLFNHIAMTIGNVKGGRVTNAEIEAHLKARSLPDNVMQAWDQVETGKSLTADQRKNFINLGQEVRNSAWEKAYERSTFYGVNAAPPNNPHLPARPASPNAPNAAPPTTAPGNKIDSLLGKYK